MVRERKHLVPDLGLPLVIRLAPHVLNMKAAGCLVIQANYEKMTGLCIQLNMKDFFRPPQIEVALSFWTCHQKV